MSLPVAPSGKKERQLDRTLSDMNIVAKRCPLAEILLFYEFYDITIFVMAVLCDITNSIFWKYQEIE